jgi:cytidine deaminase
MAGSQICSMPRERRWLRAHSPYSKFPVGAAILTEDGRVLPARISRWCRFPEGWCAETTALGHYVMGGGGRITDICVTAEKLDECTPCGGCRQRLAEFAEADTLVHLTDQNGITKTITMAELLPLGFKTEVLSK